MFPATRPLRRGLVLAFVSTAMLASTFSEASADHRRPRIGAYVPPAPESGMQAYERLETSVAHALRIVSFYQAWGDGDHGVFHREWLEGTGGRRPLLTWEPWSTADGSATQRRFRLRRILRGAFDDYIEGWARGLKTYGKRVFLRPMHEMNGNWYPWSGTVNGNTPRQYRRAWRRIHGIFERVGATNVRWVWSPYALDVPSTNRFERYYPGRAYVDVLALDGYNWGGCAPQYGGWQSFRKVFASAYDRIVRLGPQRVWIAETASAPEGGDKAKWVQGMMNSLEERFPRVGTVVWFHTNKECDWRLTTPWGAVTALASTLRLL